MRRLLLLAAVVVLTACHQSPVSPHSALKAPSLAEQLKAEGDAFMAAADYVNAVEKYRQAAEQDPAAIGPRFALGTAYSFLEKRPEAIAQFRWVVAHADSSSTEYRDARRWLVRVGAPTVPTAAELDQRGQVRVVDPSRTGHLIGRTEWPEVTPQRRLISGSLFLTGDEPATQDVERQRAFRLGDAYEFRDVPPGRYRLVAVIDETMVWDEKVTVDAEKDTPLTLSQSMSPVPVGKFAPPPSTSVRQQ